MQHTILVLAANPVDTRRLRLDQEVRDIREGLQRSQQRDGFKLEVRHALRAEDLYRALLEVKPTIVHFCGHGEGLLGLMLEDQTGNAQAISNDALGKLFDLFKSQIQCVVLNACYSTEQAKVLTQYIPHVIGMSIAIPDKTALQYAVAFYDALGAGQSFEFAHQLGVTAIGLQGLKGADIPVLMTNTSLLDKPVEKSAIHVFISYSKEDKEHRKELEKRLKNISRQFKVTAWSDEQLLAGGLTKEDIKAELTNADLILLLISSNFFNDDDCYETELPLALKRYQAQQAIVIPIIVRNTPDWEEYGIEGFKLGKLTPLPKDGLPLKQWPDKDEFWADVQTGLKKRVQNLLAPD
ncbi:TIR domain-containing protein [Thiofilum flexile]|uniref:TIR domain-containing protein n=1 Tax=Thiofilum flexile TaxID=125627 RepID=UPI000373F021|nr:TIR domain-containing protein [Thiofilum flexile]